MGSDGELLAEDDYLFSFQRSRLRRGQLFREVEGSSKVWKRFALLPNIQGQKYTLGDEFNSREEQGEVIFWYRDDKEGQRGWGESEHEKRRVGSMAEIKVVKNKYWVRPLGEVEIGINGTQIRERTELRFGDYLVFGGPEEANRKVKDNGFGPSHCAITYPSVLWFQKRELNPDAFLKAGKIPKEEEKGLLSIPVNFEKRSKHEEETGLAVVQNELLLSHILSYIPIQKLPAVRLVSKIWDSEAKKLLRKKGQIIFNFLDRDRSNHSQDYTLLRYSHEMRQNPIWNWSIRLPAFQTLEIDCPRSKVLSDLNWFFSKDLSCHVTKLQLHGGISSKLDFDVRMKILQRLQGTLEELDFRVYSHADRGIFHQGTFPSDIEFHKLKSFLILGDPIIGSDPSPPLPWWEEGLMPRITRVTKLYIPEPRFLGGPLLQKLSSFSNLEKIELETTTPAVLATLLRSLKKGLKSFKLMELKYMIPETASNFSQLLQAHAHSLESLTFNFPRELDCTLRFIFPVLPRLRKLKIGFGDSYMNTPYEVSICFSEPLGRINYSKHLPSLEYLRVRLSGFEVVSHSLGQDIWGRKRVKDILRFWKEYAVLLNIFFPPPNGHGEAFQVCRSLKVLDIPFQNWKENPEDKNVMFPRASELAGMFPNVSNEWTMDARLVPYPEAIYEERQTGWRTARSLARLRIDMSDWFTND